MKTVKYRSPYNVPRLSLFNRKNMYRNQEQCRKICEHEIKRLKKDGVKIIAAKQYLENLIFRNCSLLRGAAEQNHFKNLNEIQSTFNRRASDLADLKIRKEHICEQLSQKTAEYEMLEKVYKELNPLTKGHLNMETLSVEEEES